MSWTIESPSNIGWYWYNDYDNESIIVEVGVDDDGQLYFNTWQHIGYEAYRPVVKYVKECVGEWYKIEYPLE